MPLLTKSPLDKGNKHATKGLNLFDKAIANLHTSNEHLEKHAAETKALQEAMIAQHNEAVDKIVKNKGIIGRLEGLLYGTAE